MSKQVPWLRIAVEVVAVVGSILLAFAIDAWWDRRVETDQERESLEVLVRDLSATIEQLTSFQERVDGTVAASLGAYAALSAPRFEEDRTTVSAQLVEAHSRTTMRIPRAGYTDLLSTGTLGLVRSRALRDSIIQFYESAQRYEVVIEKNSTAFTDGRLADLLVGEGLVYLVPWDTAGMTSSRDQAIRERLGVGFQHRPHPLWELPPDSKEWDQLRSALLLNARGGQRALELTGFLISDAMALQGMIESHLAREAGAL